MKSKKRIEVLQGGRKLSKKERLAQKIQAVEGFIEIANKIPPDYRVVDIKEFLNVDESPPLTRSGSASPRAVAPQSDVLARQPLVRQKSPEPNIYQSWLLEFRVLLAILDKFPAEFREYVLEDSVKHFSKIDLKDLDNRANASHFVEISDALGRYRKAFEYREQLRKIVRMKDPPRWFLWHSIDVHARLYRVDGVLELRQDAFTEALEGLETDRVRECPICGKLFYARRANKSCCSDSCANVYHVRTYRGQKSKNREYKRRQSRKKGSLK